MSTDTTLDVYQLEFENEALSKRIYRSEAAARGKCVVPKWLLPPLIIISILALLGAAFAMGYFISYPRTSTIPFKLFNETCTVLSLECDSSRGLYCPSGQCLCELTNSYYNGSSCICPTHTRNAKQACISDALYGQTCNLPTIKCVSNYICSSTYICTCNITTQFYNESYCITKYSYNASCTQTLQCQNTSNLYCISSRCTCAENYYWNGTDCIPKLLGWETCSNITNGMSALPCDDTLDLYCYSNYTCQCPSTSYWDTSAQQCEIKRRYGENCTADFNCNETLHFICPTVSGTCNCPSGSNAYTCDCQGNWFYDGLECLPRKSINGTCPGTYACDVNTPLVCSLGLCLCPTPTTWNSSNCVCPSGQTWSGSACIVVG